MRPRKTERSGAGDLFRARLDQIIDMRHEVVRLADRFSGEGRPGTESRFMVGILLLKHIYGLSEEGVCER